MEMNVMKKSLLYLLIIALILVISGCNNDSTPPALDKITNSNEIESQTLLEGDLFGLLQSYADELLKSTNLPAISAKEVYEKVVLEGDLNYFVVDIRSPESFADGHIEGAVNIPYNLTANPRLLEFLPMDKKIVVACYSGSTAGQTAMFWQMLGLDAYPLLNGMGGWNTTLWSTGGGTALPSKAYDFGIVTDKPATKNGQLPKLNEKVPDLQSLIIKRSQDYLNSGKGPVINALTLKEAVIDNMDDHYFLVDVRNPADYEKGHILHAINIQSNHIAEIDNLKQLPTDKKIIIIGYDGTDASQITRVLNIFGYDSYALLQGMRVWTSNAEVNGIAPVSAEIIVNHPIKKLNYDLEGGGGGTATCG